MTFRPIPLVQTKRSLSVTIFAFQTFDKSVYSRRVLTVAFILIFYKIPVTCLNATYEYMELHCVFWCEVNTTVLYGSSWDLLNLFTSISFNCFPFWSHKFAFDIRCCSSVNTALYYLSCHVPTLLRLRAILVLCFMRRLHNNLDLTFVPVLLFYF